MKITFKKTIVGVVFAVLVLLTWQQMQPAGDNVETDTVFTVQSGTSVDIIAEKLRKEGLIRSPLLFRLYARMKGLDRIMRSGRFSISPGMSVAEIAEALVNPQRGEFSVTFPEGLTIAEMDERFFSLGLVPPGRFMDCISNCPIVWPDYVESKSLEGFLFPDTYFISAENASSIDLINTMLETFDTRIEPLKTDIAASGRTIQEIVTMASIIEKEVRTEADYELVSGILWKRFDSGGGLYADATLLYGKNNRALDAAALEENSPYNTRKYRGLPPTAISNPGLRSLRAAVYPRESEYWFYLTRPETGEVVYAKTNDEHNENKAKYLR